MALDKLKNYYYYEKHNLITRDKVLKWKKGRLKSFLHRLKTQESSFRDLILDVSFYPYPKQVTREKKNTNTYKNYNYEKIDSNDFLVFADLSVEAHLICTLWAICFGPELEKTIDKSVYGNRISQPVAFSKHLYKKYHQPYNEWISNSIESTNSLLKGGSNATIVTFDLRLFYHTVDFSFKDINKLISKKLEDRDFHIVHDLFISLHVKYSEHLNRYLHVSGNLSSTVRKGTALPIGALSSFVLANYYLKKLDAQIIATNPVYYGRYVDDVIIVYKGIGRKKYSGPNDYLLKNFGNIFHEESSNDELRLSAYSKLKINKEKSKLYQFKKGQPLSLLTSLLEEQKSRSSEFRYLSDAIDGDEDEMYIFDDDNLSEVDSSTTLFADEDNKFYLMSKLAKLANNLLMGSVSKNDKSVISVFKYAQTKKALFDYSLWEKMLSILVLNGDKKKIESLLRAYTKVVEEVNINSSVWGFDRKVVRDTLFAHLNIAFGLSLAIRGVDFKRQLSSIADNVDCSLLRDHYSVFPFFPYLKYSNEKIDYSDHEMVWKLPKGTKSLNLDYDSIYVGKPFYWCYFYVYIKLLLSSDLENKNQRQILREAVLVYDRINKTPKGSTLFKVTEHMSTEDVLIWNVSAQSSPNASLAAARIGVVNQNVPKENFLEALKGSPVSSLKRERQKRAELDSVVQKGPFYAIVKPELSIPVHDLYTYIRHSAKHQYSLNSGIEFQRVGYKVYNTIVSTLPIKVDGYYNDTVPLIRLKNEYTYKERQIVEKESCIVPRSTKREYFLLVFNKIYSTSYYCYELTSIEDRSLLKGHVDIVYAPIWNMDSFYYRAISESIVRDLHCFFIQANTSEFADSRVIQPTKSINIEKSSVKGGTVDDDNSSLILLVDELPILALREFQRSFISNYKTKSKEYGFKPLPPFFNSGDRLRGE